MPLRSQELLPKLVLTMLGGWFIAASLYFGTANFLVWGKLRLLGVEIINWNQDWKEPLIGRNLEGPMVFNGVEAKNGIGTHAYSKLKIAIRGSATRLNVACGYPDYVGSAQISCLILQKGQVLATSPVLSKDYRVHQFSVPIEPAEPVELEVKLISKSAHHAHATWFDFETGAEGNGI
jgi:hypothetical protein